MRYEPIGLRSSALSELMVRGLDVPRYDRTLLRPRIVHIGVGGFHRSHLAVYCDHLADRGSDWGVCGVGLLPGDQEMGEALARQEYMYTVTLKGPDRSESAVVGSIIDFLHCPADATQAVSRIANPTTAIVSMTVTESGYDDSERNRRTFDVIAAGLDERRRLDHGGVTILSCDNLPGNGDAARRCVLEAARRRGGGTTRWIEASCTFPNSMVDRITPVTTDADRHHLLETYGLIDERPVVAEQFWQWAIEDRFAAGQPGFATVGAILTDDVHAWELYKLRLLNAAHSAIAYLCALEGITYVDEAIALPDVSDFLERLLVDEAVPTIAAIPGHPPSDYVAEVLKRFANRGIRDQIARLCVDGTSKYRSFLMPTIAAQIEMGGPIERSAHALAGWAHYLADLPEAEQARDSLGDQSRAVALAARSDPALFVDSRVGFPSSVTDDTRFIEAFAASYRSIAEHGPIGALRQLRR